MICLYFEWNSRYIFLEIIIAKPAAASRSSRGSPCPTTINYMYKPMPGDDPGRVALSAAATVMRRCSIQGLARDYDAGTLSCTC